MTDPGEWHNFKLRGNPTGDTIVSLHIDGYWTNPGEGWTGPEELHYGVGDIMQVRVPSNAASPVDAVVLFSTKVDYDGDVDAINADPTSQAWISDQNIQALRQRVDNSGLEATVGLGHPDGSITCDFDADWGDPVGLPIPEPTTLGLLAMSGLMAFRRKR